MIKKKIQDLFMPWLCFSVLNIIASHIITFNSWHTSIGEELFWNFLQIRGHGDGMWFIACLFIAFIPFWFAVHCLTERQLLGTSITLYIIQEAYAYYMQPQWLPWKVIGLPWHIEYIFIAMLFMTLGYLYKTKVERQTEQLVLPWTAITVSFLYLSAVTIDILTFTDVFKKVFILSVIWRTFLALLGITACITICKLVPATPYTSFVGQNTLSYFGLHGKAESVFEAVYRKLGITALLSHSNALAIGFCIGTSLVISLLLIPPTIIINRFFPFLSGKSRKKL